MNKITWLAITLGAVLLLILPADVSASITAHVYAEATLTDTTLELDIYADIQGGELISFGTRLMYDPADLTLVSAEKNETLWYLGDASTKYAYDDPVIADFGELVLIGGKFDADNPAAGLTGTVLLGSVSFTRNNTYPTTLSLTLGKAYGYKNFVTIDGDSLDAVDGAVTFTVDIDGDGYASDTDCDDTDSALNPETLWYQDNDGDGFGNYSLSLQQCTQPGGPPDYVLDNKDYDDNDPNIGAPISIYDGVFYYYSSLQAAYDAALDGDTIEVIAVPFSEDLYIDISKSITFLGGYDGSFTTHSGYTILNGDMTISDGIVMFEYFSLE